MRIVVCLKQVPNPEQLRIHPQTGILIREGVEMILNPYDYHALEEAMRIKDETKAEIIALTMGPPDAEMVLKEAVSMGADDGILLSDQAFAGADTLATAYALAQGIKTIGNVDIILCGRQSVDGETGHVGPQIGEFLGIHHVVEMIQLKEINEAVEVWHRTGYGKELLKLPLPVILSLAKGINEPRLPSLRGKMRAKKHIFRRWGVQDIQADPQYLGIGGSPTQILETFVPPATKGGQVFSGSVPQQVTELFNQLGKSGTLSSLGISPKGGC